MTMSTSTKIFGSLFGVLAVVAIANMRPADVPTAAEEDPVQAREPATTNAHLLCIVFEYAEVSTQCETSKWDRTIDVVISVSGAEARALCPLIDDQMRNSLPGWDAPGWRLRIFSPYSHAPIAACDL